MTKTPLFTRRTGLAAALASVITLIGVAGPSPSYAEDKSIKVGIISGEDEDVWRVVTAELTDGAIIGVPNDPSNEGRALRILQNEGIIKLKGGTGILATIADIEANPKNVEIKELDAGVVGRAIEDLDGAVVNTDTNPGSFWRM